MLFLLIIRDLHFCDYGFLRIVVLNGGDLVSDWALMIKRDLMDWRNINGDLLIQEISESVDSMKVLCIFSIKSFDFSYVLRSLGDLWVVFIRMIEIYHGFFEESKGFFGFWSISNFSGMERQYCDWKKDLPTIMSFLFSCLMAEDSPFLLNKTAMLRLYMIGALRIGYYLNSSYYYVLRNSKVLRYGVSFCMIRKQGLGFGVFGYVSFYIICNNSHWLSGFEVVWGRNEVDSYDALSWLLGLTVKGIHIIIRVNPGYTCDCYNCMVSFSICVFFL
ncbi:unnamed protein product [Eruca vesicaria subsp. sativa]|uniref:Uncharacterized protein n=1 Tax=Eruca vesicaria subsp. sativa TaxID=29727 RepID=A0ABC8LZ69_ERUVS|nr:unnamed protein product [Eruca vesicaria subsp. sativa]